MDICKKGMQCQYLYRYRFSLNTISSLDEIMGRENIERAISLKLKYSIIYKQIPKF